MEEFNRTEKISYGIYPGKILLGILTVVSGVLTIVLSLILLKGIQLVIAILILLIIILLVFLVVVSLRLREVVQKFNSQTEKLHEINDNRNTLKLMVEEKNEEIELLQHDLSTTKAQGLLLYTFLYSKEKPEKSIVKKAFNIEQDKVISNEEQL